MIMTDYRTRDLLRQKAQLLRRIAIVLLALYWALIFVGTHVPSDSMAGVPWNDKVLHFTAYGGLAFLLACVLGAFRVRVGAVLAAMLIAVAYGAFDELTQTLVRGRGAEWLDWLADAFGAAFGVLWFALLSLWLEARLRRPSLRPARAGKPASELD